MSYIQNLKVEIEVEVSNEDIDDIVSSALEGGINYWCCSAEIGEEEYLGEYASEQISRGGTLILYDSEDDETYVLTKENLLKGIAQAIKAGHGISWIEEGKLDLCTFDAGDADLVVQYALFGEVVFG